MSTTSGNTSWTFEISGGTLDETGLVSNFQVSLGGNHPASWSDSAAITLASQLQAALVGAGFSDAAVAVVKDVTSDTTYTVSGGQFS